MICCQQQEEEEEEEGITADHQMILFIFLLLGRYFSY
jgi:hypothetical protein